MRRPYRLEITGRFISDVSEAARYIGIRSDDPEISTIWQYSLQEHLQQLELFPASYPMHKPPYRQLNHGMYKVFFRIDEENQLVIVCRLVHSARLPLKRKDFERT